MGRPPSQDSEETTRDESSTTISTVSSKTSGSCAPRYKTQKSTRSSAIEQALAESQLKAAIQRLQVDGSYDLLSPQRKLGGRVYRGYDSRTVCCHPSHQAADKIHMMDAGEYAKRSLDGRTVSAVCAQKSVSLEEALAFDGVLSPTTSPTSTLKEDPRNPGHYFLPLSSARTIFTSANPPQCFYRKEIERNGSSVKEFPNLNLCWVSSEDKGYVSSRGAMRKASGIWNDQDLLAAANPGGMVVLTSELM